MRLAALALALAAPAAAHDWYDPWCCHDKDCAPIPLASVEIVEGGYRIDLPPGGHPQAPLGGRFFVPFRIGALPNTNIRWSRDGDYHACILRPYGTDLQGETPELGIRCLYVPGAV